MEKVANPLISIVVPVYNVQDYINRCVESLTKQTYKNLEIILVDDGSTDNSPKMCDDLAKKDNRIKVIHKKNGGVSSARNVGIDNAKGEYISFVDSDDWIDETFCEEMYNTLISNNTDYIMCGYKRVYEDGHMDSFNDDNSIITIDSDTFTNKVLDVEPGYGFVHMKMLKRDKIGKVRFNESLKVGEDALFNIQLCENIDKVTIFSKPLYNYFFNANSLVRKYDSNYVNKYYESMEAMYNFLGDKNNKVYKYISFHVLLVCVNYCYHPDNKEQMKSLKEVCNMPLFKEAIKKTNYDNWSITRKVTLFTIKHKLYLLTAMICKIRQKQFKK